MPAPGFGIGASHVAPLSVLLAGRTDPTRVRIASVLHRLGCHKGFVVEFVIPDRRTVVVRVVTGATQNP